MIPELARLVGKVVFVYPIKGILGGTVAVLRTIGDLFYVARQDSIDFFEADDVEEVRHHVIRLKERRD